MADLVADTGKRSLHRVMSLRKRRSTGSSLIVHILICPRKMENFIRTKYESKRWATDGAIPDPATLDSAGDDDVVGHKMPLEKR